MIEENMKELISRYTEMIVDNNTGTLELLSNIIKQYGQEAAEAVLNLSATLSVNSEKTAILVLQQLTKTAPYYAKAWVNLGGVLLSAKQYDQSIEVSKHAIDLDPMDEKPWNNYGASAANQGDYKKAYECFYKAFTISPDKKKTQENLARCAVNYIVTKPDLQIAGEMAYKCSSIVDTPHYKENMKAIMEDYNSENITSLYFSMIALMIYLEEVIFNELFRDNLPYVINCMREKAHFLSGFAETELSCDLGDDALISLEIVGAILDVLGNHYPTTHATVTSQYNRIRKYLSQNLIQEAKEMGRIIVTCPHCHEETTIPNDAERLIQNAKVKGDTEILSFLNITTNCINCSCKFYISDTLKNL